MTAPEATDTTEQADLIGWLRAQLGVDERVAHSLDCYDEYGNDLQLGTCMGYPCERYIAIGKNRVLAEVEAKRRLLDLHQRVDARDDWIGRSQVGWPPEPACYGCHADFSEEYAVPDANDCPVARLLALPYADRPGYRPEWRP